MDRPHTATEGSSNRPLTRRSALTAAGGVIAATAGCMTSLSGRRESYECSAEVVDRGGLEDSSIFTHVKIAETQCSYSEMQRVNIRVGWSEAADVYELRYSSDVPNYGFQDGRWVVGSESEAVLLSGGSKVLPYEFPFVVTAYDERGERLSLIQPTVKMRWSND